MLLGPVVGYLGPPELPVGGGRGDSREGEGGLSRRDSWNISQRLGTERSSMEKPRRFLVLRGSLEGSSVFFNIVRILNYIPVPWDPIFQRGVSLACASWPARLLFSLFFVYNVDSPN